MWCMSFIDLMHHKKHALLSGVFRTSYDMDIVLFDCDIMH